MGRREFERLGLRLWLAVKINFARTLAIPRMLRAARRRRMKLAICNFLPATAALARRRYATALSSTSRTVRASTVGVKGLRRNAIPFESISRRSIWSSNEPELNKTFVCG
jgi:hypothetical protein